MKTAKLILLATLIFAPVITRAGTVISYLPYNINASGTYVLSNNLTVNGGNGILVNASNVTIDLSGLTLTQSQAGNGVGINIPSGMSNVRVQNGTITGFYFGVLFQSGSGDSITNVQLLNINYGVYVLANDSLIENCNIVGATSNSSTGILIASCGAVGVRNNRISQCFYGVSESSVATPNTLIGNVEANCSYGLSLGSTTKYQGNVTTNCTTAISGGIAIGHENG